VKPPRSARNIGRNTWQRNHSRMNPGTSTQAVTPAAPQWWARRELFIAACLNSQL